MFVAGKRGVFPLYLILGAFMICHGSVSAQQDPNERVANALFKLDAYAQDAMKKTGVPGASVAVVFQDQVVFLRGYGVRKIGEAARVNPDTVFEIASFSKPVATTVVAALVGRGVVSWDSRIKDLDPSFELSDPTITQEVTVRDMLSHRSTLPGEAGDALESLGYGRPEILDRLRLVALKGVFRKTYSYSNYGITEGALAATRSTGKTWEEVSEELLYNKLGMTRTSSRFSDYADRPNRAALHYLEKDGIFRSRYVRVADAESPAGGVKSSARDLAQWLRLHLAGGAYNGEQIVGRAALEETYIPEVCRNPEKDTPKGPVCPDAQYYGLGWDIAYRKTGEKLLSHSGAFMLGSATAVYMIPNLQIGIVVLSNGAPVGLPESIALTFLDDFQYGIPQKDYLKEAGADFAALREGVLKSSKDYSAEKPPSNPSPGVPPASLVGTYDNRYFGKLEIEEQQGKLILRLPPLGTYYELSHWDGNTYTYYIGNEVSGATRRGIEFTSGGRQVTVENLKFEYSNVFDKVAQ
jgi:CubicO group peptidase (beta-lactamase class C family)